MARNAFETIEVHSDMAAVTPLWLELRRDALCTPYQTPGLLGPWAKHVAANEGFESVVIVARDEDGQAVALLPLGIRLKLGVRVARFMGGSHINYNLPVIRRDRLDAFTPREVKRFLKETARALRLDAFALCNQPFEWNGVANPFAALPRQPAPDSGFYGLLASNLDEHVKRFTTAKSRSNHRRKMRLFEERGRPRIFRASTPEDRTRLLDAYFAQKAHQFSARGIPNVFERPGVHAFLTEASAASGGVPTIDLFGFDLDGEVIAVTGGITDEIYYSGIFISITSGEHAKYSPGKILLNFVVEQSIERGVKIFDLGVGTAHYKQKYCPNEQLLFDSIFGLTPKGRIAATAFSTKARAKAKIKATPWAYELAQRLRLLKAQHDKPRSASDADDDQE